MNCIKQRNPLAGFTKQHSIFCHYCEAEATHHYNTEYSCGNVCEACARKHFKPYQVEEGTFRNGLDEDS